MLFTSSNRYIAFHATELEKMKLHFPALRKYTTKINDSKRFANNAVLFKATVQFISDVIDR